MTNEVEEIILKKINNVMDITYSENTGYQLYKQVWEYIGETLKYNPYKINFQIIFVKNDNHESEKAMLRYCIVKYSIDESEKWLLLEGYDRIKYKYNTINYKKFIELINRDDLKIEENYERQCLTINISIDRDKIANIIDDILIRRGKMKKLINGDCDDRVYK